MILLILQNKYRYWIIPCS